MKTKVCTKCKIEKPETQFYLIYRGKNNRQAQCKQCVSKYRREQRKMPEFQERESKGRRLLYQSIPQKVRRAKRRKWYYAHLLSSKRTDYKCKYNITLENYFEMLKKQNHCCAICGICADAIDRAILSVDHNHKTSKFRGLLCNKCNLKLGFLENNKKWIEQATHYRHLSAI